MADRIGFIMDKNSFLNLKTDARNIQIQMEQLIFPLLYQLRQIRKEYKAYHILVTLVQLISTVSYLLEEAIPSADNALLSLVTNYKACITQNRMVYDALIVTTSLFLSIIASTLAFLYARKDKIKNHYSFYKGILVSLAVIYSLLQIVVVATFVIILKSLHVNSIKNTTAVSYGLLPFLTLIILIDSKRRLLQYYLLIIGVTSFLLQNNIIHIMLLCVIVTGLTFSERESNLKKVIYLQMSAWCCLVFLMRFLNKQLISNQSILIILAVAPIICIRPPQQQFANAMDENAFLLDLLTTKSDYKFTFAQQLIFLNLTQSFLQRQNDIYQTTNIFSQSYHQFSRQKCLQFALAKIQLESQQQNNNNSFQIQCMYFKLIGQRISMETLLQIRQLSENMKGNSTLQERFELFDMTCFVQKKYLQKQEHVNAITIIDFQKKQEAFYSYATGITVLMLKYWQLKQCNQLTEHAIFTILEKVQDMEAEMESILDQHRNSMQKERILHTLFMRLRNSTFQSQRLLKDVIEPNSALPEMGNCNYILVEQNRITEMSCQLRNHFGLKKERIKEYSTTDILPTLICKYLKTHIDHLTERQPQTGKSPKIILPFITPNQKYIIPLRISLKIIPDILNSIKYIFQCEDSQDVQKAPSFLYEASSDRIVLTTSNISTYLSITAQVQLGHQFASDIFGIDIFEKLRQRTEEDQPVQCQINLKSSERQKKGSKTRNLPVALKMIQRFQIEQQNLFLIQIYKRRDYESKIAASDYTAELQGLDAREGNGIFSTQKERDIQGVFCKISNPYEHVIHEKFIKLSKYDYFSYPKVIATMLIAILGVTTGTMVLIRLKAESTGSDLVNLFNANHNKHTQISNIYMLYSESALLHHLRNYPSHFQQMATYNISNQIVQCNDSVASIINLIINLQLTKFQRKSLNITLQYNNFNLTSTTNSLNIEDYLQYAQESLATDNLTFLLRNWPGISIIISSYQTYNLDTLHEQTNSLFITCGSAVLVIAIAVVAINAACLKINTIINRLLNLYEGLSPENSAYFVRKLSQFTCILNRCNTFTKNSLKNQISLQAEREEEQSYHALRNLQESMSSSFQQNLLKTIKTIQNHPCNKQPSQNEHNSIQRNRPLMLIAEANIVCLVPIILALFFSVYSIQISQYKIEMTDIMDYADSMHNSSSAANFQASNYLVIALQQILAEEERMEPHTEVSRQIPTVFQSQLPSYYNDFMQFSTMMLNQNICNYSFLNTSSLYQQIDCQYILGGVMQKGFAQTLTLYLDLTARYTGVQMADFGSKFRTDATYPAFMQIYYIRRTLHSTIVYLQDIFSKLSLEYISLSNNRLKSFLNYCWLLLLLSIVLCAYYYRSIHTKCRLALRSFYILPKPFLLQTKITKALRKEGILDQIQRLSF